MEKETDFIIGNSEIQRMSSAKCEWKELGEDISVFSGEKADVVKKLLSGLALSDEERSLFYTTRNEWFLNKYGFPYSLVKERNEVLIRKYALTQELIDAQDLQKELFKAFSGNNVSKIGKLKKEYEEKFPDQLEGITALFEFKDHLFEQKRLNKIRRGHLRVGKDEKEKILEGMTQYQFLLTHFVLNNKSDKNLLKNFWVAMDKIASDRGELVSAQSMRRGILSQVASHALLEGAGLNPRLSHPREDAFKSIDLWVEDSGAIQVKGSLAEQSLSVLETEEISFPGIETEGISQSINHFNSNLWDKYQNFKVNVDKYGRSLNKKLKGYFIVLPNSKIDFITGEPSEELKAEAREKLVFKNPDKKET